MKYPQPTIWQSINVALLGLAASGCGRPLPTPPADSFRTHSSRPTVQLADRVQVHILDSTGRHLERANVSFSLPRVGKDDVLSQAVTDGVGQAILSIPEAARHELLYGSPAELWIVDSQGYVSVGHLSAEMLIAGVGLIEARVAPTTNVVNVRVLAPDGQPVPNARVAVDTLANAPDDPGRRVPNETWLTACTIADRQGRCRVQVPLGQLNAALSENLAPSGGEG